MATRTGGTYIITKDGERMTATEYHKRKSESVKKPKKSPETESVEDK